MKRKNLKRFLALLTTAALVVSSASVTAFATDGDGDGATAGAPPAGQQDSGLDSPANNPDSGDEGIQGQDPDDDDYIYWQDYDNDADESYIYKLGEYLEESHIVIRDTRDLTQDLGSHIYIYDLIDTETGEHIPVYCIDERTGARVNDGFMYKRENVEDATSIQDATEGENRYYTDEQAANIRAILKNGYKYNNPNSVSDLAEKAEVTGLTNAEAMAATQWAIWKNSNSGNYLNPNNNPYAVKIPYGDSVDAASKARIEAVCNYLMSLEGIDAASSDETVIITTDKLANSNITKETVESATVDVAKDLDVEGLENMNAGDKALQKSGDNAYLITKNDDGTYTVEVVLDLKQYGDLSNLTLDVKNNDSKVLTTELGESKTDGNTSWTITEGVGTFLTKMKDEVNDLQMHISGNQTTAEGYYVYESQIFSNEIDFGGGFVLNDYVQSQNFVGFTDRKTEEVVANLTFKVYLPEPQDDPDGDDPSGDDPSGDDPSGDDPSGDDPSGDDPSGDDPSGDDPSGDDPSGDDPSGDEPSGDDPAKPHKPGGGSSSKPVTTPDDPTQDDPSNDDPVDDNPTQDDPNADNPDNNDNNQNDPGSSDSDDPIAPGNNDSNNNNGNGSSANENGQNSNVDNAGKTGSAVVSNGLLPQTGTIAEPSSLYLVLMGIAAVMAGLATALWMGMNRRREN